MGQRPKGFRDPVKVKAQKVVYREVRAGRMKRPDAFACTDCGHTGPDRRHEYDHHKGYARRFWLVVEPVCSVCHSGRERRRRASWL